MSQVHYGITCNARLEEMHQFSSCWRRKHRHSTIHLKFPNPLFFRYANKAALETHAKTDHFKAMNKTVKKEDLLAEPMKIVFTKEVGGYASKL